VREKKNMMKKKEKRRKGRESVRGKGEQEKISHAHNRHFKFQQPALPTWGLNGIDMSAQQPPTILFLEHPTTPFELQTPALVSSLRSARQRAGDARGPPLRSTDAVPCGADGVERECARPRGGTHQGGVSRLHAQQVTNGRRVSCILCTCSHLHLRQVRHVRHPASRKRTASASAYAHFIVS
jgi:hypothetical protein